MFIGGRSNIKPCRGYSSGGTHQRKSSTTSFTLIEWQLWFNMYKKCVPNWFEVKRNWVWKFIGIDIRNLSVWERFKNAIHRFEGWMASVIVTVFVQSWNCVWCTKGSKKENCGKICDLTDLLDKLYKRAFSIAPYYLQGMVGRGLSQALVLGIWQYFSVISRKIGKIIILHFP